MTEFPLEADSQVVVQEIYRRLSIPKVHYKKVKKVKLSLYQAMEAHRVVRR
jgi:hypothetical protein